MIFSSVKSRWITRLAAASFALLFIVVFTVHTDTVNKEIAAEEPVHLPVYIVILCALLVLLIVLLIKNYRARELYKSQMVTLSTIYRSLPDRVFCMDINGTYTSCNQLYEEFAGYSEAELIGKTPLEVHKLNKDIVHDFLETDRLVLEERQQITTEEWLTYPDHSRRLMETVKTPLIQDNKVIGLLGISRDITEHREALEAANAASEAKTNFLAKMSHEIRTPMNAVIGMAELALRENEIDAARKHIFTIKQAGAILLSLINDILDFSKIESGKFEIIPDHYMFPSLINDVISIIRMRAMGSQLRFVVNIDSNIPNELYGDETRIRQVLINILGNAVKYTEKGFVTFTVMGNITGEGTIILTMDIMDSGRGIKQEDLDKLFFDFIRLDTIHSKSIEGTGLGLAIAWNTLKAMNGDIHVVSEYGKGSTFTITLPQKFRSGAKLASVENPEEKSVIVFERRDIYANSIACTIENLGVDCKVALDETDFFKKMDERNYPFIFIASKLFDLYKDAISRYAASSKIVLLTEFGEAIPNRIWSILAMPVHSLSVANILNGVAETYSYNSDSETFVSFTAPDAKILIVDDIKTNLTVAKGLLLPYNMQVDLCRSGAEAIQAAESKNYDLIFMDHWMPEMDGVEAARHIRELDSENNHNKKVPIIALTANAVSGTQETFLESGFSGFLAKPIDMVKLDSILEKWIPREKRKSPAPDSAGIMNKEQDASKVQFEIEGIDVNRGIAFTGGSVENYRETLAVFYEDGLMKINQLNSCLEMGDITLYSIYAHALRSAAANIGAIEISNAAKNLEMAGKQADLNYIETQNDMFVTALKSLLNNINSFLSAHSGEETKSSTDSDILFSLLTELKTGIENMDAGVINKAIDDMLKLKLDENIIGAVRNISNNILIAEYDEAFTLTESLINERT